MSTSSIEHIVQELDRQVLALGALVERALVQALEALQANDDQKAISVVIDDTAIDHLHLAIEEHSIVELTQHQPFFTIWDDSCCPTTLVYRCSERRQRDDKAASLL